MSRIKTAFDRLNAEGRKALIPFITAGDPDAALTLPLMHALVEAGADVMYADALLSKEDIAKVAKNVPKPLIVNMGLGMRPRKTTPLMSPKQLQDIGVGGVSYPRLLTTAALRGMMNALEVFKDEVVGQNKVVDRTDLQVGFEELNDLMGMKFLDQLEEKYKGG
jgi:2-methylisocitrate lyase-like PEP mutase family enzyme